LPSGLLFVKNSIPFFKHVVWFRQVDKNVPTPNNSESGGAYVDLIRKVFRF
jgi:hypothetical protein